jgi:hypothetical protein
MLPKSDLNRERTKTGYNMSRNTLGVNLQKNEMMSMSLSSLPNSFMTTPTKEKTRRKSGLLTPNN